MCHEKDEKIKKLEENNYLLQGIFESIQEGISVLSKDLTICFVNDNEKKMARRRCSR